MKLGPHMSHGRRGTDAIITHPNLCRLLSCTDTWLLVRRFLGRLEGVLYLSGLFGVLCYVYLAPRAGIIRNQSLTDSRSNNAT